MGGAIATSSLAAQCIALSRFLCWQEVESGSTSWKCGVVLEEDGSGEASRETLTAKDGGRWLPVHSRGRGCCSGDEQHRIVGNIHGEKSAVVEPPVMSVLVRAGTVCVCEAQVRQHWSILVHWSTGSTVRQCDISHRP